MKKTVIKQNISWVRVIWSNIFCKTVERKLDFTYLHMEISASLFLMKVFQTFRMIQVKISNIFHLTHKKNWCFCMIQGSNMFWPTRHSWLALIDQNCECIHVFYIGWDKLSVTQMSTSFISPGIPMYTYYTVHVLSWQELTQSCRWQIWDKNSTMLFFV